jgi:hypothetical protein
MRKRLCEGFLPMSSGCSLHADFWTFEKASLFAMCQGMVDTFLSIYFTACTCSGTLLVRKITQYDGKIVIDCHLSMALYELRRMLYNPPCVLLEPVGPPSKKEGSTLFFRMLCRLGLRTLVNS